LKEKLASAYDVKDLQAIFLFGFRTQVCTAQQLQTRKPAGSPVSDLA
jgi:hypothetical protein